MSQSFDPYYKWLGIPPDEQPPDYYRLLGVRLFEADADVIAHAADRQMAHVRSFQTGRHAEESQRLLNELSSARLCLLTPESKASYDARLAAERTAPTVNLQTAPVPPPQSAAAVDAPPRPAAVPMPSAADEFHLEVRSRSEADVPARGWGWKAVVGALCIGLAAVAVAWKYHRDKQSAEAADASQDADDDARGRDPDAGGSNHSLAASNGRTDAAPRLPDLPGAVDLLADVDPSTHALSGEWRRAGTAVLSPAGSDGTYAMLQLPADLPAEYTLVLLVERVEGNDALAINFPIGEHRGVIVLDSTAGKLFESAPISGLDRIDSYRYTRKENPTRRQGRVFGQRRLAAIVCNVHQGGVRVTVDGREIIHWQGEPLQLSVGRYWRARDADGNDAKGIALGSYRTSYRFVQVIAAPLQTSP